MEFCSDSDITSYYKAVKTGVAIIHEDLCQNKTHPESDLIKMSHQNSDNVTIYLFVED